MRGRGFRSQHPNRRRRVGSLPAVRRVRVHLAVDARMQTLHRIVLARLPGSILKERHDCILLTPRAIPDGVGIYQGLEWMTGHRSPT